jgi:hypothetical protein
MMSSAVERTEVIEWLMRGDPAVRWQTMRDVLGVGEAAWKRERRRVATEGWGSRLLSLRDPGGTWGGGIYGPKWTSTTYTLLLLRDMGLAPNNAAGAGSARLIADRELGAISDNKFAQRLGGLDQCIVGMDLSLLVYFGGKDARIDVMVEHLLGEQMDDGGWNCARLRRPCRHSSLHTTMNVLDALAEYVERRRGSPARLAGAVGEAMGRAYEFMLRHRLFRSDRTGKVIRDAFTKFSFPPRWHFDVLRGLDHFRRTSAPRDERLADAIELLLARRGEDGAWKLQNHHKGKEFFRLEQAGRPSRWNTMRALRVLRWWG